MRGKFLNCLFIICIMLIFIILTICSRKVDNFLFNNQNNNGKEIPIENIENVQKQKQKTRNYKPNVPREITTIPINQPINLSYKTKKEIYDIRKSHVQNSIFANKNYELSEEVFGQIVDGKPWISTNKCDNSDGQSMVDGPSIISLHIVNPSIPVLIRHPWGYYTKNNYQEDFCSGTQNALLPKRAEYIKSKNEIIVYMDRLPFKSYKTTDSPFYQFIGLNAKDYGYNYVFLDRNKSTLFMNFVQEDNLSMTPTAFKDFIHVGMACGREGGCNNFSPLQPQLGFQVMKDIDYPAEIYLKLWKNKPLSLYSKPDLVEIIKIEKN